MATKQACSLCVEVAALQLVDYVSNLGAVYCVCKSFRQSFEAAKIWYVRLSRRGLILPSESVVWGHKDFQAIASSLLQRFIVITNPLAQDTILRLGRCAEFIPPAVPGETSFCIELENKVFDESPDEKHFMPSKSFEFDGDHYSIDFEEALWDGSDDESEINGRVRMGMDWEPKQVPPYEGLAGLANVDSSKRFGAVRARVYCLFLTPSPQLTEVSPYGKPVFRMVAGALPFPGGSFQGHGQGWYVNSETNFVKAWRSQPSSGSIFIFLHLASYRTSHALRQIMASSRSRQIELDEVFAAEEANGQVSGARTYAP